MASFCFKLDSSLKIAHDEMGPVDTFARLSMGDSKELDTAIYESMHRSLAKDVSKQFGVKPEAVTLISEEEYVREVED